MGGANGTIAIADFDRKNGTLSNVKKLITGDVGYHASFSPDGTKLYYVRGTEGWNGIAYQWDIPSGTETKLGGTKMAAAKLAPDGKVYWAGHAKTHLGVVDKPDALGVQAGVFRKRPFLGWLYVGLWASQSNCVLPRVPASCAEVTKSRSAPSECG